MKQKSIAKNAVLNVIRNISNIVFPLITFPYVSRVLGVEGLGKYNFANSVISYFILIAGLGISSYAIREGSRIRDDKDKISEFCSEMFAINIGSTVLSYILLVICLFLVDKFSDYRALIIVFSFQIIATTIGIEWLYSIYEEYTYITIRTIVFKIISLILLFVFVRTKNDVLNYAAVTVFALGGSGVLNFIHSRKYCTLSLIRVRRIKEHLKPILILFSSSVAVMIYVYSDTTILGFLKSDYEVGLYALSSKIYTIIKSVLSATLIVSIPRLSALYGNEKIDEYNVTLQRIINSITILLLPCVIGIVLLSENIVVLVGGIEYRSAALSLRILGIALLFCLYGWIFNQCVLLPTKNEKIISTATIVSALLNIGLNFILIPLWDEKAAALTTLLAELLMLIVCYLKGKHYCDVRVLNKALLHTVVSCIPIIVICLTCMNFIKNNFLCIVIAIIGSAVGYFAVLFLFKNEQLLSMIPRFLAREKRRDEG